MSKQGYFLIKRCFDLFNRDCHCILVGAMRAFFSRTGAIWSLTLGFQCGTTCDSSLEKSYPRISAASIAAAFTLLALTAVIAAAEIRG